MRGSIDTIVLLAATEGMRMRPLTAYFPKILLPVVDRPIIIHHLERAERMGITQAIIIVDNVRGHITRSVVTAGYSGKMSLVFITQQEWNGLVYALMLARRYLNNSFIVALADEYDHSGDFYQSLSDVDIIEETEILLSLVSPEGDNHVTDDERIVTTGNVVTEYEEVREGEQGSKWVFGGCFVASNVYLNILDVAVSQSEGRRLGLTECNFGPTFTYMIKQGHRVTFVQDRGPHINLNTLEQFWMFNQRLRELSRH